ncbi:DNA ligase [Fasciola hepatica]|uniref:DNA ligase n=1 Tax=Fasciola hepatica TaxID=6192 RepID=A0A4E0R2C9_FASHE|nr:DNA ligase [Fasciola hepatica]
MNIEEEGNRIAERVKFHTLCRLFEKLKVSGNAKSRRQILSRFIQLWEDQYAALGSSDTRPASGRASFYPCLRLLMPEFDRARPAYGLRETALSRLYIKAFGIAPNGPVAQSLSHPMYSGKGTDFADILFEAVRDRCREDNLLTLKDANDLLDQLASADNSDERLDAMTQFLRSATAVEQKWMIRIIVRRRSGCGLGVSGVLQCLHPAAPSLWNVTQDLTVLCQRIGEIDLHTFTKDQKGSLTPDITLFVPFRPMLCERSNSPESLCQSVIGLCSLGSVDLDTVRILLETKYDGERIQIHKSGSAYRYWSRNCLEWTSSYGADGKLKQGSLTPRLHKAFRVDVHDCILDAEIMAYNTWTDAVVPKTCGFDVKRGQSNDGSMNNWFGGDEVGTYQPCVVVFDVMYLNGKSLTSTPILERKRLLKELFAQHKPTVSEGSLEIADEDEFDYLPEPLLVGAVYLSRWSLVPVKVDQVSKIFNRLVDTRQEGLVAKLTVGISPYLPGRRLHGGWWKLKPDYVEGLLTDLDCLVVGGYYLSVLGRKTRRIGHFICAVRDDRGHGANHSDKANSLPTFLSFCRVSNGLSTSQLKEINLKLRPHWRPYDRKHPNTGLTEWLRVTTERPDVWIAPQHSITFQVHASEITSSSSYAAGMTLRFPRITAVREDKPWQDCLTISELSQLNKETEGKMTVQRLSVPGSDVDSDGESDMDPEVSQCSGHSSPEHYNDSALGLSTSGDLTDSLSTLGDDPLANSTPVKKRKLRRDNQNSWRSSTVSTYEQVKRCAHAFVNLSNSCEFLYVPVSGQFTYLKFVRCFWCLSF